MSNRKLSVLFAVVILLVFSISTAVVVVAQSEVTSIMSSLKELTNTMHIWGSAFLTMAITIFAIWHMHKTSKNSTNELIRNMDKRHNESLEQTKGVTNKLIDNIDRRHSESIEQTSQMLSKNYNDTIKEVSKTVFLENRKMTSEMLTLSQNEALHTSLAEVYATIKAQQLVAQNKDVDFLNILLEGDKVASSIVGLFTKTRANRSIEIILRGKKAKDIMSNDVITIDQNKTVLDLSKMIHMYKHTGYPVVNGSSNMVGIVSHKDIERSGIQEPKWGNTLIKDIMVDSVITCREDEDALIVFKRILDYKFGRIPILNTQNKLTGVVSRKDFILELEKVLFPIPGDTSEFSS